MKKFIVKQKIVFYQYFVVEADNGKEALKHWPDQSECHVTEGGEFVNLKALEIKEPGSFVHCCKYSFIVVTARNLQHTVRKLLKKLGRKPVVVRIDESEIQPLNPKAPLYNA